MIAVQGSNPTVAVALSQVVTGITNTQLQSTSIRRTSNSRSSMVATIRLQRCRNCFTPAASGDFLTTLAANLTAIQGQPRVWMLYDTPTTTMAGTTVRVVGFVAARVMSW